MNKFNFNIVIAQLEKAKSILPRVLSIETKKFFLNSWADQGWDGKKWEEVKRRIPGTKEYKYPKKKGVASRHGRAILVGKGTGNLRKAVQNSLKEATFNRILFRVELQYAAVHNEGLPMRNGKRMPQRRFMGDSPSLRRIQMNIIHKEIDKIWKG